jgi:hypothetical protein
MDIRDKIYNKIAYLLPDRLMYWVIMRAFAWTTTHECSHKHPDETGFSDVIKSWEKRATQKE